MDHVELRPVDPFYRIRFHDGSVFDYAGDEARMRKHSPADVDGYERCLAILMGTQ